MAPKSGRKMKMFCITVGCYGKFRKFFLLQFPSSLPYKYTQHNHYSMYAYQAILLISHLLKTVKENIFTSSVFPLSFVYLFHLYFIFKTKNP